MSVACVIAENSQTDTDTRSLAHSDSTHSNSNTNFPHMIQWHTYHNCTSSFRIDVSHNIRSEGENEKWKWQYVAAWVLSIDNSTNEYLHPTVYSWSQVQILIYTVPHRVCVAVARSVQLFYLWFYCRCLFLPSEAIRCSHHQIKRNQTTKPNSCTVAAAFFFYIFFVFFISFILFILWCSAVWRQTHNRSHVGVCVCVLCMHDRCYRNFYCIHIDCNG